MRIIILFIALCCAYRCEAREFEFFVLISGGKYSNGEAFDPQVKPDLISVSELPAKDFPPLPDKETLKYYTRTLPIDVFERALQVGRGFRLAIPDETSNLVKANWEIDNYAISAFKESEIIFFDFESRQILSASEMSNRIGCWKDGIPDIRKHVNMHAYRNPKLVRVVTLGMGKFGLPELVVDSLASSGTRGVGNSLNALAQYLVEIGKVPEGSFTFDGAKLQHPDAKAAFEENPQKGRIGRAEMLLSEVKPEDGDNDTRHMRVDFPSNENEIYSVRIEAGVTKLFGAKDDVRLVQKHDVDVQEVSQKARARLLSKKDLINSGLAPNERIYVKAPFRDEEITEWMWCEVHTWEGDVLTATLSNDPFKLKQYKAGQIVKVRFEDVFDYLHEKPDGSSEGNETQKYLQEQ